jgi:hypothetical protein
VKCGSFVTAKSPKSAKFQSHSINLPLLNVTKNVLDLANYRCYIVEVKALYGGRMRRWKSGLPSTT